MIREVYRKVKSDVHDRFMEDGGYGMGERGDMFFNTFENGCDKLLEPFHLGCVGMLTLHGIGSTVPNDGYKCVFLCVGLTPFLVGREIEDASADTNKGYHRFTGWVGGL